MRLRTNGCRTVLLSALPWIVACLLTAGVAFAQAPASKNPLFGHEVIVDNHRITGEPSLSIDGQDRIYVSTRYGFLTTASFVWRSVRPAFEMAKSRGTVLVILSCLLGTNALFPAYSVPCIVDPSHSRCSTFGKPKRRSHATAYEQVPNKLLWGVAATRIANATLCV
ncbi:MAG: hypothetical protein WB660_06615 [Candidatus Sulfotelmatobacter sp.]